ncbi:uncharacterized protein LOC132785546 [Drosophila nasuta]|uniref:uncharacterized protein LOC132785546 n=1 Tax=Drosophila nasuta TaxID=42062 RepID=UPI00295E85D4|nr:uncharacterized protein LOC132785546 [Drosophila nasuta]
MRFKFLLLFSLLLILIIISQPSQSTSVNKKNDVILAFIYDAEEIASSVRLDIEQLDKDTGEFDNAKIRDNQLKVLEHFKNISTLVHQIEEDHLPKSKVDTLFDFMKSDYLKLFRKLISKFNKMEKWEKTDDKSLISFAEEIQRISVKRPVYEDFYWDLCYTRNSFDSIFTINKTREFIERPLNKVCNTMQSAQQLIYTLYKQVTISELKGYILNEYSLVIRRVSGQGSFSTEANQIRNNYDNITENSYKSLVKALRLATGRVFRCDPKKHKYQVTYDEVTRLIQGYVENERYLNSDGSCSEHCADYQNTTRSGCSEDELCAKQPQCSGRIYNCQFIESDMSVCQSPTTSNRRYDFIKYGDGALGQDRGCWRNIDHVESWRRWLIHTCNYCFCLCDEPGPLSDRYFNLRETLSDVNANKVMTGIRFVKKNRVFHLQIQQGKLLPRGMIDEATLEWVPVDDYNINDPNVVDGLDYHTLTYQNRAVDLDELEKEDDITFVVTGVRFQVLDGHLSLKVRYSKFDFLKGELVDPQVNSIWEWEDGEEERTKLDLSNPDLPTRSTKMPSVTIKKKQYVEFVNTDMYKDAAQATVPFIDIQDIVSDPPLPLIGLGLFHKGEWGYGGFLTTEIININITSYIPVRKIDPK